MDTTITLDEPHFQLARDKAKTLGTTPDRYLAARIDADARSFDHITRDGEPCCVTPNAYAAGYVQNISQKYFLACQSHCEEDP
jgi:hypothetical protein